MLELKLGPAQAEQLLKLLADPYVAASIIAQKVRVATTRELA